MDKLNKHNYCIICLENTEGMRDEILSIAIDPYKYVKGENMLIVTFSTFMTPQEIKELLGNPGDRSYFLFEMNPDTAMVLVSDKTLQSYLFEGFSNPKNKIDIVDTIFGTMGFNKMDNNVENDRSNHYNKMVNSIKTEIVEENKFSEEELNTLTKDERDELVDDLLEKGANLTDDDKKVLNFLINKKN